MYADPRDPRHEALPPTPEELDAWVRREHERRAAWLTGPTEAEKDAWARRYRRRAALGLAESALGPSPGEVEQWAQREHQRRQAWIAGPTDQEKRDWAGGYRHRGLDAISEPELPPTQNEIDAWAERERGRRKAWLDGPTEREKQRWIHRETTGFGESASSVPGIDTDLLDAADRLLRETDLAAKGSLVTLMRAPLAIWSYFVRSGRQFEEELYQPPPRRRVRF